MQVLGLAASARIGGNTEILLDEFLAGAEEAGADVQKLRLVDYEINYCRGCGACNKAGICRFQDGVQAIQEKMLAADILVLATPVYFYSVTGLAKMLIDRSQALWVRKHLLGQSVGVANGRGVLISVGATRGERLFEGINLTARYFMDSLGKKLAACLCYRGVDEKGEIRQKEGAMQEARALGREMVAHPEK